jgi:putative ABC transport system permease protein
VSGLSQQTLREELLRLPNVASTTLMVTPPWTDPSAVLPFTVTPPAPSATMSTALVYIVGEDFFETLDIALLSGRDFDAERASDIAAFGRPPSGTQSVVISRALAEELGASPAAIVGRQIWNPAGLPYEVIGVAEDSVLSISADAGPRPRIYLFNPVALSFHVVRLSARDVSATVAAVDALWQRLAPDVAIKRRFADDYFDEAYASFARIDRAFSSFAAVALAIAIIGLGAIALSVTSRRRAEIGIRKIMGGSTRQVTLMLLASFGRPVLVANLIAWPFGYIAARAYLNGFIEPIGLSLLPFVTSLMVTAVVGALAVAQQTVRAARVQPAAVLRQE